MSYLGLRGMGMLRCKGVIVLISLPCSCIVLFDITTNGKPSNFIYDRLLKWDEKQAVPFFVECQLLLSIFLDFCGFKVLQLSLR